MWYVTVLFLLVNRYFNITIWQYLCLVVIWTYTKGFNNFTPSELFLFHKTYSSYVRSPGKKGVFSSAPLFYFCVCVCWFPKAMNDQSMRTCPQSSALRPDSLQCWLEIVFSISTWLQGLVIPKNDTCRLYNYLSCITIFSLKDLEIF